MKQAFAVLAILVSGTVSAQSTYLGDLSANTLDPNSTSNPLGRYGSSLSPDSINNPLGRYGSPYSPDSANNPYATNPPRIIVDPANPSGPPRIYGR